MMPSNFDVLIATEVSISACANEVKAGLPSSQARMTPFRRGRSAISLPQDAGFAFCAQNIGSNAPTAQSESSGAFIEASPRPGPPLAGREEAAQQSV